MGTDAMVAATPPATHAPVKRLSQQSSSGGNSPSALSMSVPTTGSKVSSYAMEDIRDPIQLII